MSTKNTLVKRTRVRWNIAILMWGVISINYIDRTVLSVVAPSLSSHFHLSEGEMGIILSSFFWSYVILQIPSGWFADKVGQRLCLAISVAWWSIAMMLTGLARGFGSLLGLRILLGMGEAGAYPCNAGITAKWFPDKERARVASIFDSGSKFGTAIAMPFIVWIVTILDWKAAFLLSGLLGFVWIVIWLAYYRDPEKHKYINQAELDYIKEGQTHSHDKDDIEGEKPSLKWYQLLKYRNVWALCLGHFSINYTAYFFITWFPSYLIQERGMKMMTMGFVSMIPPLVAIFSQLFAGWLSDKLYEKGMAVTRVRKTFLVSGLIVATTIGVAALIDTNWIIITLMSLSYAGLTFAGSQVWAMPAEIAPKNMASTLGGIQNTCSNMAGLLGPIITGFIVQFTGSFVPALLLTAVLVILGALNYLFLLGEVKPIKVK
ncbi:MFS transporter [Terrilactibacillus sp. BCM23-1]|uniref:MFS transporter n=1 Tax=Terrilactibacillus tamarindi TaxID=2599694 RepID=A0A6N8CTN5_9BACI|nr:MFS transporter [Terrilactibacillus tamarindi]MTT32335.1 MFS transporter [Terrilactibacillus tamarindi]